MVIIMLICLLSLVIIGLVLLGRALFAGSISFIKTKSKSVSATVCGKRKQQMMKRSGVYTNYFITFDLGGGDKIELPVNKRLFREENVGKSGTLTYKGNYFVDFTLDKEIC